MKTSSYFSLGVVLLVLSSLTGWAQSPTELAAEGAGLLLKSDKLSLQMWHPDPTPGQPDIYKTLFEYSFPAWDASGKDLSTNGTVSIRDKVFIGDPATDKTPDAADWKLTVNGSVKVKELIVDKHDWADFVFDDDYDLMPIPELADWIETHGHLPNMPTQSEIKRTGIDIASVETKLLQKVEELTLYVIQLQKQIDELKQQK